MKKVYRFGLLLLTACLAFSFAGCGEKTQKPTQENPTLQTPNEPNAPENPPKGESNAPENPPKEDDSTTPSEQPVYGEHIPFKVNRMGGSSSPKDTDSFRGIALISSLTELKEYSESLDADAQDCYSLFKEEADALKSYTAEFFKESVLVVIHEQTGYEAYPYEVYCVEYMDGTIMVTLEEPTRSGDYDVPAVCGFWAYHIECERIAEYERADYEISVGMTCIPIEDADACSKRVDAAATLINSHVELFKYKWLGLTEQQRAVIEEFYGQLSDSPWERYKAEFFETHDLVVISYSTSPRYEVSLKETLIKEGVVYITLTFRDTVSAGEYWNSVVEYRIATVELEKSECVTSAEVIIEFI